MIGKIINGHMNELLSRNQDISKERLEICRKCPLFAKGRLGTICNPDLYMNPETKDVSAIFKEGYIRGCGCRLKAKTASKSSKCPTGQW